MPKEREMKTFAELRSMLIRDLTELEKLEASRFTTIEQRHVKEQEIGRHCYEAEEDLSPLELSALKRILDINDTKWQAFKARFIDGSSPGGLV
jgi:hypothetical protein